MSALFDREQIRAWQRAQDNAGGDFGGTCEYDHNGADEHIETLLAEIDALEALVRDLFARQREVRVAASRGRVIAPAEPEALVRDLFARQREVRVAASRGRVIAPAEPESWIEGQAHVDALVSEANARTWTIDEIRADNERLKADLAAVIQPERQLIRITEQIDALLRLLGDKDAELRSDREATDDALNKLWQLVYPGKTDWEYPGMVVRHVKMLVEGQAFMSPLRVDQCEACFPRDRVLLYRVNDHLVACEHRRPNVDGSGERRAIPGGLELSARVHDAMLDADSGTVWAEVHRLATAMYLSGFRAGCR